MWNRRFRQYAGVQAHNHNLASWNDTIRCPNSRGEYLRKCSAYLLPSADESEGRKRRHLLQPWELYRISSRLKCNPLVQISLARSIDNMAEEKSGQSGVSDTPRKGNMPFTGTKGRRLHPPARTVWAPQICRPRVQSWETDGLYNCQYQQLDLVVLAGQPGEYTAAKYQAFRLASMLKCV